MVRSPLVVLLGGLVGVSCSGEIGSGEIGSVVTVPLIKPVPGTPECVGNGTANGGHCPTFRAGAVCEGVDMSGPAADMLRGKHLIIQDMDWLPYASPDPEGNHPSGWTGLNIELFDHFASVLGFTYNMSDMGYAGAFGPAETWTEMAYRAIDDADLTGSYWTETNQRLNGVTYVRGTYDLTPVLAARMLSAGETKAETWQKSFYNYLDPFTYGLWCTILAVIICSGVVDWLVERKSVREARVTSSIYEYFAGLLWGGFEYPLSKMSAVYQVLGGFIVLVLISSYTANLAAFITLSAQPTKSIHSMDQAQLDSASVCAFDGGHMGKIKALYPRIRWGLESQSQNEAAQATMDRKGCDGVVATYNQYQAWRTDVGFCKLEIAQVMAPARGHWLTNRQSPCVAAALNYAISEMDIRGDLELKIAKYFPKISCGDTSAGGGEMDDNWEEAEDEEGSRRSRRQLSKKDATVATKHRRRLSAAGGSGGGGGGVPKMEILDFLGMFIIWLIVTVWMLVWTYAIPDKCKSSFRKLWIKTVTLGKNDGEGKEEVDVNNDSLVLREVLKQLGEIREHQERERGNEKQAMDKI